MTRLPYNEIELKAAGGSYSLAVTDNIQAYRIYGTATLVSNVTITVSGSPQKGDKFVIFWDADVTLGGNTVTIFGKTLTATQAATQSYMIILYDGAAWKLYILPDFEQSSIIDTVNISDDAVTKAKLNSDVAGNGISQAAGGELDVKPDAASALPIAQVITVNSNGVGVTVDDSTITAAGNALIIKDAGVTLAKLADQTRGYVIVGNSSNRPTLVDLTTAARLLGGNGTDAVALEIDGTNGDIAGSISSGKLLLDIGADKVTPSQQSQQGRSGQFPIEISFESGEMGTFYNYTDISFDITKITYSVKKDLNVADPGIIDVQNDAGASMFSTGAQNLAPPLVIGDTGTLTPDQNTTIVSGESFRFVTSKTTAGGKLLAYFHYERIN